MKKTKKHSSFVTCIIAAGGSGTRMNTDRNKLLLPLCETPVIAHTLIRLQSSEYIDEIIISAREEDILEISDIATVFEITKLKSIVRGGKTRAESILSAISEISENAEFVAVHDGARPVVSEEIIKNTVIAAEEFGAAACGVKPKCTLKRDDGKGFIGETVDRNVVFEIQTPQVFKKELFLRAYEVDNDILKNATDDCSLVEHIGAKIKICDGEYSNIKITTPEDILIAEAILNERM